MASSLSSTVVSPTGGVATGSDNRSDPVLFGGGAAELLGGCRCRRSGRPTPSLRRLILGSSSRVGSDGPTAARGIMSGIGRFGTTGEVLATFVDS